MNNTGSPVLSVAGLVKTYPYGAGRVQALDGVDFSMDSGEFVAVMGASGSGKSTLVHLIAGLSDPDQGGIHINGQDLLAMGDRARTLFRRRHIGLVFQAFNLIPDLSGRENILIPSMLGGADLDPAEPDAVIGKLGIADSSDRLPDAMSGGEQQRVAIARALVTRPDLLLADEPTGNLDTANSRSLCTLLRGLCQESGTTVLMVSHNPAVAFNADRILIMCDGRILEDVARDRFEDAGALGRYFTDLLDQNGKGDRSKEEAVKP